MARNTLVAVGDRFVRAGQPQKVYVVTGLREKPGFPPHAELRLHKDSEPILIGVSALMDRILYQRVREG